MVIYILKFSACLAVLMLFYKLILEQSSIHKFKRFYLLGALIVALTIPYLTFIEYIEPVTVGEFTTFVVPDFEMTETTQEVIDVDYTPIILWSLYVLGVLIFLLKFCFNLNNIISRIKSNPKLKSEGFINVLVSNLRIPHTFFNYIFFDKKKYELGDIPHEVLIHEQTHAKQKHSIDVLLLELLQIIFWFNPLIYLLKREVKLNHEYLADQAVLQNGIQPSTYQTILLAFSSKVEHQELANAINYSSIKKRFTVMKTHTSKTSIWLRSLLILPVLAILLYGFTEREQVVKKNSVTVETDISEGATDAMMKEYKDWIKQLNNSSKLSIPVGTFERIVAIYDLMSEEQRNSVETHPFLQGLTPNLYSVEPSRPTTAQFESWKNEKEFAIWLDGKHISNSELNNYKANDITYYVGSSVYKNALSEKFPQPFQYNLYTKEGYNKFFKEVYVSDYKALNRTYSNLISAYLKGSQTDNSELRIIKAQADKFYNQFTKEDLKEYSLRPAPTVPMQKSFQEGATPEQVAEYNTLAKKYNAQPQDKRIIKRKDIERLEYLYKIMSDEQKKNAEPFPNCPPPPPPPPPILSAKQLEEYNKLAKKYNDKPLKDRIIKVKDYEYLEGLYQAMSKEQKESSQPFPSFPPIIPPPPPPPAETKTGFIEINNELYYYVEFAKQTKYYNSEGFLVSKEGKTISKSRANASDIIPGQYITKVYVGNEVFVEFEDNKPHRMDDIVDSPPPPPPAPAPKSTLDFVIELAKKNAKFYFNKKEISSDEAISILKKNPEFNLLAKNTDKAQPLVYISKEPIKINKNDELVKVNDKTPIENQVSLTNKEAFNFKLSLSDAKVLNFKLKVPGQPTRTITGNTLDTNGKSLLRKLPKNAVFQLFDIKDSNGFVHLPVVISIIK
nr:M56 family metallopeptidase [uncultured Psychroserpens sp.]